MDNGADSIGQVDKCSAAVRLIQIARHIILSQSCLKALHCKRFVSAWQQTSAMQASSEVVRKAIAHVRDTHPHWARKDGADHFMVFSYDHGRCDMAPGLQYEEFGRMFAIQSYGDIMST